MKRVSRRLVLNVRLSPEEHAALAARAEEQGRSMSDVLRRAAFGDDGALFITTTKSAPRC